MCGSNATADVLTVFLVTQVGNIRGDGQLFNPPIAFETPPTCSSSSRKACTKFLTQRSLCRGLDLRHPLSGANVPTATQRPASPRGRRCRRLGVATRCLCHQSLPGFLIRVGSFVVGVCKDHAVSAKPYIDLREYHLARCFRAIEVTTAPNIVS